MRAKPWSMSEYVRRVRDGWLREEGRGQTLDELLSHGRACDYEKLATTMLLNF